MFLVSSRGCDGAAIDETLIGGTTVRKDDLEGIRFRAASNIGRVRRSRADVLVLAAATIVLGSSNRTDRRRRDGRVVGGS